MEGGGGDSARDSGRFEVIKGSKTVTSVVIIVLILCFFSPHDDLD